MHCIVDGQSGTDAAAAGMNILAKRPDDFGKGVIAAALVETYAIFAVLVSLLLIIFAA